MMSHLRDVVVFDLEIINGICGPRDYPESDIRYCDGWGDYAGMGISVLCAYSYASDNYRVFLQDNLPAFFHEFVRDDVMLVGFNNRQFDNNVLNAWRDGHQHKIRDLGAILDTPCYDIQRAIRFAISGKEDYDADVHRGYGLEAMCLANGIPGKAAGGGAQAPINWQRGNPGVVIDYCLWDVGMTKTLFDLIRTERALTSPKNTNVRIRPPVPPEIREFFTHGGARSNWSHES